MGGEKLIDAVRLLVGGGSPPRGRGKDPALTTDDLEARITPAWAGKSAMSVTPINESRDHPRVGGEKIRDFDDFRVNQGSPPRGRGKD